MQFRMPPETHLERLKLAATYLSLQRGARRAAWGSIGWGAFTLAIGSLSRSHTLVASISIGIGLLLLFEGAWVLKTAAADPRIVQMEAATLLLLGLWNTVGLYFEIKSGVKPVFGLQIIFAGIVQLLSAYSVFRAYPFYKQVYSHLDWACLQELEIKIGDMWQRKANGAVDLAEFKSQDKKCRARFLPDLVIVLTQNGQQVSVLERAAVKVENDGNKLLSKQLKVELALENEKLKTEMNPECYQKWEDWLSENSTTVSAASRAS